MTALFRRASDWSAWALGSPVGFALALAMVIIWAVSGPIFRFSDTWQLYINTPTTVLTFLAVFLIQNQQNRQGAAIQLKLDELIRASAARNAYVCLEDLSEAAMARLRAEMIEAAKTDE